MRRRAAIALARVGPEDSIPERVRVLIEGLGDAAHAALSDECAEALVVTPGDALPPLVEALSAEAAAASTRGVCIPSRALRSVARVIARTGESGTRALVDLARDRSALVRGLAVANLGRRHAPIARPIITEALRDPDARVQRTAVACARRMGLEAQTADAAGFVHRFRRTWRMRLARLRERLGHG